MKCACCQQRSTATPSGTAGSGKLFRCGVCGYDQHKNLFGQGQYPATPKREYHLRLEEVTTPAKILFESQWINTGLLSRDEVLIPRGWTTELVGEMAAVEAMAQEGGADIVAAKAADLAEVAGAQWMGNSWEPVGRRP